MTAFQEELSRREAMIADWRRADVMEVMRRSLRPDLADKMIAAFVEMRVTELIYLGDLEYIDGKISWKRPVIKPRSELPPEEDTPHGQNENTNAA